MELDSLPKDMTGVMLQMTMFVRFSVMDSELLDLLSIVAATSPVCKTKIIAERIIRHVACFDDVQ